MATGENSRLLGNAFCIALLLTGNFEAAVASVLKGIRLLDGGSFSCVDLIQPTVQAAMQCNVNFDQEALAMLPFELRRLFGISPMCRRCFVLRFLAGLKPIECSAMLRLSDQEFEISLGEALHSLAQLVLAEIQQQTEQDGQMRTPKRLMGAQGLPRRRFAETEGSQQRARHPLEFTGGIQEMTDRARIERTRIALVTGANKGIGKEISRQLSTKGIHVLMGARDAQRGEEAAAELRAHRLPVEFLNLDVTSEASVDAAASEVEALHGRLDVLVNNAGIAVDLLPGSELTMDELQKTFETNVFGVFRVTKAMLPLLRRSKHARIVNMTSGNGSFAFYANPQVPLPDRNTLLAYSSSKAALNMITLRLANELRVAGIKVNAADPGSTATEMNQYRGRGTVEEGAATAVRLALLPDDGPTGGVFGKGGPEPW